MRVAGLALTKALQLRHNASSVDELRRVPAEQLTWPLPTQGWFLDDGEVLGRQPWEVGNAAQLAHCGTLRHVMI